MKTRIIQDEREAPEPVAHAGPPKKQKPTSPRAPQRRRVSAWFARLVRFAQKGGGAFAARFAYLPHGGS